MGIFARNLEIRKAYKCDWAILSNGRKVWLHLGLGNKESVNNWTEFSWNMIACGLQMPLPVISDYAPDLILVIGDCFTKNKPQRCLVHKHRNIAYKHLKCL